MMKCIQCNDREANKDSGLCDACERVESKKINGILYLPALGIIFNLVSTPFSIDALLTAIIEFYKSSNIITWFSIIGVVIVFIYLVVLIMTAWCFFGRKKVIRKIIIPYYSMGLITALYFTVLPSVMYSIQIDQGDVRTLISGMIGVFVWIPYFIFSKRINSVFCN